MPDFDLYQWPVTPDDLNLSGWWRDPAMLRLLTREYAKYLTETIRIDLRKGCRTVSSGRRQ